MAIGDVTIVKQGDLFPDVETIVRDENGAIVDVTGAAVTFSMRNARDPADKPLDGEAGTVLNGAGGRIAYQWLSGDTSIAAGTYEAEFRVDPAAGDTYRVPTSGYLTVVIEERVATAA